MSVGVDAKKVCYKLNIARLFKLRLAVARFGEMDCAGWWNTRKVLGERGALLIRRGFPRTHLFAQARIVFEVARRRSREVYDRPDAVTLWALPQAVEEQFQSSWHEWLDDEGVWRPFFQRIVAPKDENLLDFLLSLSLVEREQADLLAGMRPAADGRALPLPNVAKLDDAAVALLAAGFSKSEPGRLTVPFIRKDDLNR